MAVPQAVRGCSVMPISCQNRQYFPPILGNIPKELQRYHHWVVWKAVPNTKQDKPGKIPIHPGTGNGARTNDPRSWGTFAQASAFCQRWLGKEHSHIVKDGAVLSGPVCGIGFVLTTSDPFVGIDLDDCITAGKHIESWAREIIATIQSYTEISPSGKGIRIFAEGKLPGKACRAGSVEVYEQGRYLTVTGRAVADG